MEQAYSLAAALEQRRVSDHFARVLRRLERATPRGLTPSQTRRRGQLLEQLTWYRARGRFPKNRAGTRALIPTFIDLDGTRCAVAHLLDQSGEADLALAIAARDNHVRVPALRGSPEITAWLERSGLTPHEAALIQPSYCDIAAYSCVCGVGELPVVEATVVEEGDARIDAIHGASTNRAVGDIVDISADFGMQPGERVVGWLEDTLIRVQLRRIDDERVDTSFCYLDNGQAIAPDAPAERLSIDAYLAAASQPHDACVARLLADDLRWSAPAECDWGVAPSEDAGCTTSGGAATGSGALVMLALCALARRRALKRQRG